MADMIETATDTTATQAQAVTQETAKPATQGREAARAAAMAALGEDFGKEVATDAERTGDSNPADVAVGSSGGVGAGQVDPVDVGEAKPEVKKLETISPELAAAAKEDKRLQAERQRLKSEMETFQAERQKWEQERAAKAGEATNLHAEFVADPVAYADKYKLTPQQRYELGNALAWSSQPEEKRPANWRGNGNSKVLSEVEQVKAEAKRVADELAAYKQSMQEREQQAEQQRLASSVADEVVAGLPAEGLPHVRAFLETNPAKARSDFWIVANQLKDEIAEEIAEGKPARALTAALIGERYEKVLEEQAAWARKVYAAKPATPAVSAKPASPPASATASPVRPQAGVIETREQKRERLKREAAATISDDF
jgi:hypothetical protein